MSPDYTDTAPTGNFINKRFSLQNMNFGEFTQRVNALFYDPRGNVLSPLDWERKLGPARYTHKLPTGILIKESPLMAVATVRLRGNGTACLDHYVWDLAQGTQRSAPLNYSTFNDLYPDAIYEEIKKQKGLEMKRRRLEPAQDLLNDILSLPL
jgi:hypothetical protein